MASTTHTRWKADVSFSLASACMLSLVLTPCTLGQSASFDGVGHLPGGGEVSAATAVSGDGSVVVGSSDSANSTISEAFRWTSSGGIVGRGINESGDIEGWVAQLPESDCFGDVDGDGNVGVSDLLALLAAWGTDPGGPPDFDGDGTVGVADLLVLLGSWGPCP